MLDLYYKGKEVLDLYYKGKEVLRLVFIKGKKC